MIGKIHREVISVKKRLLVTGFDPFGGENINPAWEAVQRLPDSIGDFVLCKLQIPTVFQKATEIVLAQAKELRPDVILCVGQAGGRSSVTPERIAVNIRDARIPDNAGNTPSGEQIDPDGPAAYFSTLPVKRMAEKIAEVGLPATVSNSAGAFVCNDVLYSLLHYYHNTKTRVGFIHVPYLPSQGNPNLPLEDTVHALVQAISAL